MGEKKSKKITIVLPQDAPLIKHIQLIAEEAMGMELNEEFQHDVAPAAKKVAEFLGCTDIQAILFCIIFNLNFRSSTDISDLAQYLNCSMIKVTTYVSEIEELVKKRLIKSNRESKRRKTSSNLNCYNYTIIKNVFDSIIRNDKQVTVKVEKLTDIYGFINACTLILRDSNLDQQDIFQEISSLYNENKHINFIQDINRMFMMPESVYLYICVCISYSSDEQEIDLPSFLERLFDFPNAMIIKREFLNGTHSLLTNHLVQFENGSFRTDRVITLTEKSLELLFNEDKSLFIKNKKEAQNVIKAESIAEKKLFFSGELKKQLDFLTKSLSEPNYSQLRDRLKSTGSKGGLVVLLHGASGGGKTEYVYQLAKSTNRDLVRINISDTKSKWFGESEKLIKKLFDDYRKCVEYSKVTPILLIDEADGLISGRKTSGYSSSEVSNTEAAIRSILLTELSEIDGIFCMTSNLSQNFSSPEIARRCLFQIPFDNKGNNKESRFLIWQDKIVNYTDGQFILAESDFMELADQELTGSQIDNICKKIMMNYLLIGQHPAFDEILSFCNDEKGLINQGHNRIGYLQ